MAASAVVTTAWPKRSLGAGAAPRSLQGAGALERRPIKVIHIIDDLGLGGAQRQLVALLSGLSRKRYDAEVVSLSVTKTHYAGAVLDLGLPLRQFPQAGRWDWRCFWMLTRHLRSSRPTIVHTWLFTADLYGRLSAALSGVPVRISAIRSVEPWKPPHHVAADRILRHLTSAFIVNAHAIEEVLVARERVLPSKIRTIYNGIDRQAFDSPAAEGELRRRLGIGEEVPLVGIIGRLGPEKDQKTFLRAASFVRESLPQAHFLLVGEGPLKGELRALARCLHLNGHVRFLGSRRDIASILQALDLVVVSSLYEGCCNVILEGMAMAKPVVATAVGGNPELVVDGVSGRLVEPENPAALAGAIVALLREPSLARHMGEAARRRVERLFSVNRMVQQTEELYQELVERIRR